jgi:aspartate aminotransferase
VLAECFATGATVFAQPGGLAALEDGGAVVAELRERYAANRARVMEILATHPGIELPEPEGAFYAFPKLPGLRSSLRFAQGLLAEENVGVAPGYTFGAEFEEHFRVCFALSAPRLEEGLRRIARYIDRHGNSL